jgi:sugar lactone lactonase YvrE
MRSPEAARPDRVPVGQPTFVAFGGPDLLFVTSARVSLETIDPARQPSAGGAFVYKMGCTGLAEHRFILDMGRRRNVEGL